MRRAFAIALLAGVLAGVLAAPAAAHGRGDGPPHPRPPAVPEGVSVPA